MAELDVRSWKNGQNLDVYDSIIIPNYSSNRLMTRDCLFTGKHFLVFNIKKMYRVNSNARNFTASCDWTLHEINMHRREEPLHQILQITNFPQIVLIRNLVVIGEDSCVHHTISSIEEFVCRCEDTPMQSDYISTIQLGLDTIRTEQGAAANP